MDSEHVLKILDALADIAQVVMAGGVIWAWLGVREAVRDSQIRSTREAGLLAIKEAEIFAGKLIPEYERLFPLIRGRLGSTGHKDGDFRPSDFKNDNQKQKFETAVNEILHKTSAGGLSITFANKLESFAMAFTKRLADESVVYESVARTYCDMVEELYFFYCDMRSKKHSGGYENTINLYKKWRKRLQIPELRAQQKEIETQLVTMVEEDLATTPIGV